LAEPAAFGHKAWNQVPTWIKLLVRRYTIEDGVVLIQPVDIPPDLQEQMGIQNVKGYFHPPPKDSKKKKGKFVPKRGNLVQATARDVKAGRELEHMVLFEGERAPRAVTGALLELVDPNQWFIDLVELPSVAIFHAIMHEQMMARDRQNDDLRNENKRKQKLVGASEQLEFLVEQDYITMSGTAKDGLTMDEREMQNRIAEYERFEVEIEAAAPKDKGNAKQEQFDYYVEEMWPMIQAYFLRDPSEAWLNKVNAGTVAGTGGPRGGSQPLLDAAQYAGLLCILPSGALVESTALSVSHFMMHNEDLELALFFQGGRLVLPQPDSPLAGRVFVKGVGRYHQRRGKLLKIASQDFDRALRQSNGRNALYQVQLDEEHDPVDIKGEDLELQRIPKSLLALQQLVPGLDDAAIAKSVELYWHETKKKAIMRGQLIEDETNEVCYCVFVRVCCIWCGSSDFVSMLSFTLQQHYKALYKQVVDLLNAWKGNNIGKRCAVDITTGKKSINSCISLAASNVSNVDLYHVDYKGQYNTSLHRPMFGVSFLAHLPHSELAAGISYLKQGKEFFKQQVYDQAAVNFKLSRDRQATELETLTVDVYIALAECYDAWDALELGLANSKLYSLKKAVTAMQGVEKGNDALEQMFSVAGNPLGMLSYHEKALHSLMQWITEDGGGSAWRSKEEVEAHKGEAYVCGNGMTKTCWNEKEITKTHKSLLMKLRRPTAKGRAGEQVLEQCRSFFHVAFLFLEGAKRMHRRKKYDGASLFLYRLLEWISQYRLAAHHGIFADIKDRKWIQQFAYETNLQDEWLAEQWRVVKGLDDAERPDDVEMLRGKQRKQRKVVNDMRAEKAANKWQGDKAKQVRAQDKLKQAEMNLQTLDGKIAKAEAKEEQEEIDNWIDECK
jgi:hypothetical protein